MIRKAALTLALGVTLLSQHATAAVDDTTLDTPAEKAQNKPQPEAGTENIDITACTVNEDCTIVEAMCGGWTTVNKKSEAFFGQFTATMRSQGKCPPDQGEQPPKPSGALCSNKICHIPEQPQD